MTPGDDLPFDITDFTDADDPPRPLPRPCLRRRQKIWVASRHLKVTWITNDVCMLERGHPGAHLIGWPGRASRQWPP